MQQRGLCRTVGAGGWLREVRARAMLELSPGAGVAAERVGRTALGDFRTEHSCHGLF